MSLTERLLRAAVHRWPVDIREPILREWRAELDAIVGSTLSRRWRRLAFAVSLACSPGVEEQGATPRLWREELPSIGRAAQHLLAIAGVAVAASFATEAAVLGHELLRGFDSLDYARSRSASFDWAANAVSVAALGLVVVAAYTVGRAIARRTPLTWVRAATTGPAIVVATMGATVTWLVTWLWSFEVGDGGTPLYVLDNLAAVTAWAVCAAVVGAVVVRLVNARRRIMAVAVALVGSVVALEITSIVAVFRSSSAIGVRGVTAPLWFPLSLLDLDHSGVRFGAADQGYLASQTVAEASASLTRPLLALTGFLIAYAIHARRATVALARTAPVEETRTPPWMGVASTAICAVGVAIWGYTAAFLTAQAIAVDDNGELHLWVQELREYAILLAVLGFAARLAGRAPVVFVSVLAYGALIAVDSTMDATGARGTRALAYALLASVAVFGGGRQVARRLARPGTSESSGRHAHVAIAVIAALAGPGIFIAMESNEVPTALLATSYTLMGLLWLVACVTALASRRRPMHRALATLLTCGPAVLATAYATETPRGGLGQYGVALGGLCVVAALCAARWDDPPRRLRTAITWWLLAVVAVPGGLALAYAQLALGILLGPSIMAAAGYDFPADGLPFEPGAVVIGVVLGVLLSHGVGRPPRNAVIEGGTSLDDGGSGADRHAVVAVIGSI